MTFVKDERTEQMFDIALCYLLNIWYNFLQRFHLLKSPYAEVLLSILFT